MRWNGAHARAFFGMNATRRRSNAGLQCVLVGTEVAIELEKIATDLITRYPHALFVGGQLIFEEDTLWNRILHNETAFMVQKRLQRLGIPMIVVPVRLDRRARRTVPAPKIAA